MEIRNPQTNEKNQIIELWRYCFNKDSEGFIRHYFSNIYREENTLVVSEEGKIISSVQLNPLVFSLNQKDFDTKYIVGISSWPENRGHGAVKLLFQEVFHNLYKKNMPFALLMAIDYGLYEPYGFAHIYDKYLIKGKIKDLKQDIKSQGDFLSFSSGSSTETLNEVVNFYNQDRREKYFAFCRRDIGNFINILNELQADKGFAYYLKEKNEIIGYLLYYFENDSLTVKELIYKNTQALQTILKFLYNHNTQFRNFEIREDFPQLFNQFAPNRREITTEVMPFLMARIIDLFNLLAELDFGQYFKEPFRLKVKDPQIAENNKIFELQKTSVNIMESGDDFYHLEIDISLLTQLIFNYLTPESALLLTQCYNENQPGAKNTFFQVFQNRKNIYFNEYV